MSGDNVFVLHQNRKVYHRCKLCYDRIRRDANAKKAADGRQRTADKHRAKEPQPSRYTGAWWWSDYVEARSRRPWVHA